MHHGDDLVDVWSGVWAGWEPEPVEAAVAVDDGVWAGWEPEPVESAVAVDDGVGAELSCVLGGCVEPTPPAQEPCIHHECAWRPDPPKGTATGAEPAVEHPVDIGDDGEVDAEVGAVGGEARRVIGEGDDDREDITELVEVVAHGEHVFLAGQSSEVAVQNEHERSSAVIAEPEQCAFVIDEGDVGEQVTLADHAIVRHASEPRASSMPRWKVG